MRKIYLDIETIPGDNKVELDKIQAPSNYKDPDKIAAYKEEKAIELYLKQSLDPLQGQIACIGFAIDNKEEIVIMDSNEAVMMETFVGHLLNNMEKRELEIAEWIGYNIAKFDMPFIVFRILKYLPQLAYLFPNTSKDRSIIDLMDVCTFGVYGNYVSFDKACKFFLNESPKGSLDGSKVFEYYNSGRLQEIAEYCKNDVKYSRFLYRHLSYKPAPNELRLELDDKEDVINGLSNLGSTM